MPASDAARADLDRELASLRWHAAAMRVELTLIKLAHFYRKANFNPNQPRVPAGNPDGGQWTRDEGVVVPGSPAGTEVAARRISPSIEAQCLLQYRQDIFICNTVRSRACYAQAALRYANCLAELPIPPLNF